MQESNNILIVATQNKGKIREFAHAFAKLGKEVRSMYDFADMPDIVEDGETFADNALIKARAVGDALGLPTLADDSGLCVDALGGAPGVYSARYAGIGAADADNNGKLLRELAAIGAAVPEGEAGAAAPGAPRLLSAAQFVCALVLYDPSTGTTVEASGTAPGFIAAEPRGDNGFGYDPLFYVPRYGRMMAELSLEEKQAISHRGQALEALLERLQSE